MGAVEIAAHIEVLRREGTRLTDAAGAAGLDAAVPTCPDWRVRDLVTHLGGVYRWAAGNVTHGSMTGEQTAAAFVAPADGELIDWLRAGHALIVEALSTADPAVECFTFLPAPTPLAFWARRQAHETVIHRVDAELAAGREVAGVPPEVAADGVNELVGAFMARRGGKLRSERPVSLAIEATDAEAAWTVRIGPEGREVTAGRGAADTTVTGRAHDLYLLLWNRTGAERVTVEGDPAVLALWRERAHVRWS